MRGSSARSERLPHKQEVAGSNPASALTPGVGVFTLLQGLASIPTDQISFISVENGRLVEKARIINLEEPPG